MSRILYLTYNDAPSGIYAGQVIDVCRFLADELMHEVQLTAFVSMRGFSANKEKITKTFPNAVVLRQFPKARYWRMNRFLLKRAVRKFRPDTIIARGPFAAGLALDLKKSGLVKRVVFDGRGAYVAELQEYNVVPDERVKNEIENVERRAVIESDRRIAVSQALVDYWKDRFLYSGTAHEIIPCTLNSGHLAAAPSEDRVRATREKLGVKENEILIVYSGSAAGWQSLDGMDQLLPMLEQQPELRVLLLVPALPQQLELVKRFSDRIVQRWVNPAEVAELLGAADYGWLVREASVTNRVASPVKFAEYLFAGLPVLISPGLGDYSKLVEKDTTLGRVISGNIAPLSPRRFSEKEALHRYALEHFTKAAYRAAYTHIAS